MSDGINDMLSLDKMQDNEEDYIRADGIRSTIVDALGLSDLVCEEVDTPAAFPHQGKSIIISSSHNENDVCLHATPSGGDSVIVTVSRDIIIPSLAGMASEEDIHKVRYFIESLIEQDIL